MLMGSWPPRKLLAPIAVSLTIIAVFTTILNLQYRTSESVVRLILPSYKGANKTESKAGGDTGEQQAEGIPAESGIGHDTTELGRPENTGPFEGVALSYIKAILDPSDDKFDRLQCPAPTSKRYDYLRASTSSEDTTNTQTKYFFALNLRQCIDILPRLMGSIVEAVRFLGPGNCAWSIVEGHSDDGTLEVLQALGKEMSNLGVVFHLQTSDIDPKIGDRIEGLAALRNLALEPLINNSSHYSSNTSVIFINDVAICMEDILELVHQREFQGADMTCAMDWSDIDPAPIFYDIWIARTINGDTFWEIPMDGGWRYASNLFFNHPTSRQRYDEHKALQVFACWNGAVVFSAKPIIQNDIRFRKSNANECYAGEPRLFCKDLWIEGYSKIAVVPSVNLEYSDKSAKKAKALHGYVSEAVLGEDVNDTSLKIEWDEKPPEKVKCMADFADQSWVAWNQGFESQR